MKKHDMAMNVLQLGLRRNIGADGQTAIEGV